MKIDIASADDAAILVSALKRLAGELRRRAKKEPAGGFMRQRLEADAAAAERLRAAIDFTPLDFAIAEAPTNRTHKQ